MRVYFKRMKSTVIGLMVKTAKLPVVSILLAGCIIFALGSTASANAATETVSTPASGDSVLSADYWDTYGVPYSFMDVKASGGSTSGRDISLAFDRNFSTSWKSDVANNVAATVDGVSYSDFHNKVTSTFDSSKSSGVQHRRNILRFP